MAVNVEFENYLRSLTTRYAQWWRLYAFMDEIDEGTWFEFELKSKTQDKPTEPSEKPKEKLQPVLEAIASYAHEKILIVGNPGAGKSTLLTRIIWQATQKAQQDETAPVPVLVELKLYRELGIWELIQTSLENCDLYLEIADIKKLVERNRILLLADGFNELPTERARTEFKKFCGRKLGVIVTSRDSANDLGLERKLELQSLSHLQVEQFLEKRLPNCERSRLKELGDRVKDLGQTPLMVWMLYSIFRAKNEIPETRGEAYRAFTTLYAERAKEGIDLTESRNILSKLAFGMMQSQKLDDPTDFRLDISEVEAQSLVGLEKTLKHLVNNHLLQRQGTPRKPRICFCHQSLQEYYAAEYLLEQLRDMDEGVLRREYLNYLKWTEPVALMLALVRNEREALRLVRLGLEVDLILGARLAGEVKLQLQRQSVHLIEELEDIHYEVKIALMGKTRSEMAGAFLTTALVDAQDSSVRRGAAEALGELDKQLAIPALQQALGDQEYSVLRSAANSLKKLGSKAKIPTRQEFYQRQGITFDVRLQQITLYSQKELSSKTILATVLRDLRHEDYFVRWKAVDGIAQLWEKLDYQSICFVLQKALLDENPSVRKRAVEALGETDKKTALLELLQVLQHSK
jgi:HEAT repeat protein